MKLSIIELASIKPGETATEGLAQALDTARLADRLGYHRIWFAEHHLAAAQASHHPELLIAVAATQTRHIRVGSGAVLLNHYSPFKVAEMFKQLEAMTPGRIDLGIGRATTGPVGDLALRRDRSSKPVDDYGMQVQEVLAWLHNAFPEGHAFAGQPLIPSVNSLPDTWVLGSSGSTAQLAAQLGIGYAFAGFINPQTAVAALNSYRQSFVATPFGTGKPRTILSVNVTVGEDNDHGERLALSAKYLYQRFRSEPPTFLISAVEEADRLIGDAQRAEPTRIIDGRWPRFIAGGPKEVEAMLSQILEESGADELMIQNLIADPADRNRSHELLAKMFDLPVRPA